MMTFISQNLIEAFTKFKAEELKQNVRSNLESAMSKMLFLPFLRCSVAQVNSEKMAFSNVISCLKLPCQSK